MDATALENEARSAIAAAADAAERADHGFERFLLLAELLRALRVAPDLRIA